MKMLLGLIIQDNIVFHVYVHPESAKIKMEQKKYQICNCDAIKSRK